jgi:hypothetical protein
MRGKYQSAAGLRDFYGVFAGNNFRAPVFSGSFQLRKSGLHEKLESGLED